jgi:hypothetical protein
MNEQGLLSGRPVCGAAEHAEALGPHDLTLYVYLCNGDIEEVTPATGVRMTHDELVVLLGDIPVARFAARDVYFASFEKIAPPCFC